MQRLHDLFDPQELKTIEDAPLVMGMRHPTWFPLFSESPRAVDYLVHQAVGAIYGESNGEPWLKDIAPRLMDFKDINIASSALAELRAYGGFLEAGFAVEPIPRSDNSTPDFRIGAGDGQIVVEVFAKHQDKEQDRLLDAIHTPGTALPPGVERYVWTVGQRAVTTTIAELMPAGKPDPNKPHDSIQANLVSRVCAIKQHEHQLSGTEPALLVIDFTQFGGPIGAQFLELEQAAPIESGHHGITCGAIWYAMYGWKGAPLFQEGSHEFVRMGHDGRFRLTGKQTTKLSGVLVVFCDGAVFLENPWAVHRIPDQARLNLCQFPWFNLARSIADWQPGDALSHVELHRRMIEFMEHNYSRFEFR